MKRVSSYAAVATIFVGSATTAVAAGFKSGNDILAACAAPMGDERLTTCLGYIDGIADAMDGNRINGYAACISPNVDNSQLRDVVIRGLQMNAAHRHHGAAGLVAQAFEAAFPCR